MKINRLTPRHKNYPSLLKEIAHFPKKLFVLGELKFDQSYIAIVGSRRVSPYGREVTARLASELANCGVVVVSGLALGVDTIAHRAALEAGGKTVAVLANGLDQIYPSSNRNLAKQILQNHGAIISEYEAQTPPLKHHFPARNRIIAGLSLAVIVTEAASRSGALITASFALEQNRLVMSVPGNITSTLSEGTNNLIKSGAIAVTSASDVLAALDMEAPELKAKIARPASSEEALIFELLAKEINDTDLMLNECGWEAAKFNQVLTLMEVSGKIRSLGGGKWISN